MSEQIAGIHHVTAIATDPQQNVDFYAGVLGLRLVKKTVNFDDPGTYHFYYGDELGRPGTILTFFPWPMARRGSRGSGQATVTSFEIPGASLGFWRERLAQLGAVAEEPKARFDEEVLAFYDPDGLKLELVANSGSGRGEPWSGGPVPPEHAIRGLHSVALSVRDLDATAGLLTETMGLRPGSESGNRFRFETGDDIGDRVDVVHTPETGFGTIAAGTVHHVAWRVPDERSQEAWREVLAGAGLHPTAVLDRQYFKSIYFREPGGVLFEFATDPPGFTRDEDPAELGTGLKLPPWLEPERERLEPALPAIARPRPTARTIA
ncbi:MAG: ring-cleaving dioxygenase [bacterium]|nr:ring-cleaving dioxygenase [bacterium]